MTPAASPRDRRLALPNSGLCSKGCMRPERPSNRPAPFASCCLRAAMRHLRSCWARSRSPSRASVRRHSRKADPRLSVVVAARDPRALFDEIAPALLVRGMTSAVAARRAFADTAFGRAFLALLAVGSDNAHAASRAADFALSPFSGLSLRSASDLDATWRGDRLADAATIRRDLTAASEAAADAFAALDIDDFEAAVAAFERSAARLDGRDPAFRSEQLAAMGAARRFAAASAGAGVAPLEALSHLERASVPAHACTSAEGGCEGAPAVRFMTLDDAAELPACSCSTLVVCDLEASSYPVRAAEDGATLLMEKLGLRCPVDALAESRRRFFRALSAPRACVVCERALNTSDADEAYPAVMLEELLDCYRSAGGEMDADARVDRATGLPEPLASFAQTAGEETLHANLVLAPAHGESLTWDVPVSGAVDAASRARIVLPPPNAAADAALRCRPRRSNRILNALTNGLRSGACVRPSPTLHSARRRKAASRMRCSNASLSASAKRASRRWARTTSSGRARCSARFLTSAWQLSVHSGPRTIRSSPAPSSKRPSWTICAVNSPRSSNASRSCCQASSRRISSSTSAHTNPSSMPTVFCAAASIASM